MRGRRKSGAARPPESPRAATRHARLRFAAIFAAVAGVLLTAYSFPYAEHGIRETWFARYLAAYASVAGAVLRLGGADVHAVGGQLIGRISLEVAKNCDAMDVNILFAAAVLAFPARWGRRAAGIGVGVALLATVNVLRIASLYCIGVRWPSAFEVIHAEVWPLALVALAVAAFLLWCRWAAAPAGPPGAVADATP
jgi:exosortase/archaeosortase family protein